VRSRTFVIVAVAIGTLFVLAGAMLAYDSSQSDQIAKGIRAGGVDIGGLSASQARARLRDAYRTRLEHPIAVVYKGQHFVLKPREFHVNIDVNGTVSEAV
jgi:hypothetical protein